MEKFRRKIKIRLIYFRFLLVIPLCLLAGVSIWGGTPNEMISDVSNFSHGTQVGMSAGLAIGIIIRIRKYYHAIKSEEAMRRLYIEETDERCIAINLRIANVGFFITLIAAFVGSVVAGFFDQEIMNILLGVGLFMVMLRGVLGIYYRIKL